MKNHCMINTLGKITGSKRKDVFFKQEKSCRTKFTATIRGRDVEKRDDSVFNGTSSDVAEF